MGEILDLSEALWEGKKDTYENHPFGGMPRGIEKLTEDTWFYRGFSNTIVRETTEGLILIDPAAAWDEKERFSAVRSVSGSNLSMAIFTHGHVDHVFGVPPYVEEAKSKGWALPRVIAHESMPARFRRYRSSVGWNGYINLRQFRGGAGEPMFPDQFYYPDITYCDRTTIRVGGVVANLRHARGETDDHTWIFFPDTSVLCTGDLFIWSVPNGGNPQKVQRYAADWAVALREMAALEPEILAPGHGLPVIGADRVQQALQDTAALLESLHNQTLAMMNAGASLDETLQAVKTPKDLMRRPYLEPVYDEPEFIVRNIWRFYGGWYDGTPSHLKPAPEKEQAAEIASLAGGSHKLAERARTVASEGNLRLACHLAEWAYLSSPDEPDVAAAAAEVFLARAKAEDSTMAIGIYLSAVRAMGGDPGKEMPGETVMHAQVARDKKDPKK